MNTGLATSEVAEPHWFKECRYPTSPSRRAGCARRGRGWL